MTDGGKQDFEKHVKIRIEVAGESRVLLYDGERSLSIGRFDEADIPLTAEQVSRHHADIIASEGKFFAVDAGSRNGTWVNGIRVTRSALLPGDVIKVGSARITFGEAAGEEARKTATVATVESRARPARGRKVSSASPGRRLLTALVVPMFLVLIIAFMVSISNELDQGRVEQPEGPDVLTGALEPTVVPVVQPADTNVLRTEGVQEPEQPGPREGLDDVHSDLNAAAALEAIGVDATEGLGWEALERLRDIVRGYPLTSAADEASRQIVLLEGVRATVETHGRDQALELLERLSEEQRYREAVSAARFLSLLAPDENSRNAWERQGEAMTSAARMQFRAEEADLSKLLAEGKPDEALRVMTGLRRKFGGTEFFESLFSRSLEATLTSRSVAAASFDTGTGVELENRLAIAFEDCRFGDLVPIYYAILALDPPPEQRLRVVEGLVEALYLRRMFVDFLDHLRVRPVEVSLSRNFRGRVVRATSREVHYEFDIDEDQPKFRHKKSWDRIPAATKFELFEHVSLSREGLLGLVHFALRTGYEEGARKALIRLWKIKGSRELAAAVFSRHLGIPLPEGGFVVFEGRLVTSEEKAITLARREKAAEEARVARAELRGGKILDLVKRLRHEGSFSTAEAVLKHMLRGGERTSVRTEAKRMLADPLLDVHVLQETGPSGNRLDLSILAEGYPAKDDAQAAFLNSARLAIKLLFNEEPYREYRSYFNVSAVQLASRDAGVDRHPGEVERETALNGKVQWDRFSVESDKVGAILERLGGGGSDGQAVVIGNDYAGVATGGGGVSAVCKTSLGALPHEMGHALAGLRDEYDFTTGTDPRRFVAKERKRDEPTRSLPPNLMTGSDKEDVLAKALWRPWIEAGAKKWWNGSRVGAFEGGEYTPFNVWRPQAGCKMRSSGMNFCVVCMEIMVERIYDFARPIDRVEPSEEEIVLAEGEVREIRVWPLKPESRFLDVRWHVFPLPDEDETDSTQAVAEEKPEPFRTVYRRYDPEKRVVEIALLRASSFKRQRYRLRVEVTDPTPWVLADERGRLSDSREWIIVRK